MLSKPIIESIKLVLIYFIFIVNTISAQTFISPVVGLDFQKVVSSKVIEIKFNKKGHSHVNPFIGIKLEQKICKSIILNYTGLFSYYKIKGYYDAGFYFQDLVFKYYYNQNSFGIGYLLMNKMYFTISKTYINVLKMKIVDIYNDFVTESPRNRIKEEGLKFSTGFKYRNFDLGIYYYFRTSPIEYDRSFSYYQSFKEISSLGFELSYNFKILNGIKWKKSGDCPDFKVKK